MLSKANEEYERGEEGRNGVEDCGRRYVERQVRGVACDNGGPTRNVEERLRDGR